MNRWLLKLTVALIVTIGVFIIPGKTRAETPAKPQGGNADEKSQPCFQCEGSGKSKCSVPRCKNGQASCPAPCLKPDDGTWVRMTVTGHPPTDLWKKFTKRDGSSMAWNQNHAGEVVQMQNGELVNVGQCKVCSGTTKVKCSLCAGSGKITCPICEGKKVVPQSWSAFDYPKMKNRPIYFTLKDGRIIIGRKTAVTGSSVFIKTEKETITLETGDIVSEVKPPTQK